MAEGAARVLVIDDDVAIRESLLRALRVEGYVAEGAVDGLDGLVRVAKDRPDAIILDVCRRIRSEGDHTPVLMLTARETVEDRVAGLDAGADDYLVKPYALAELRARLRALLRRAAATDARDLFDDEFADGVLRFADLTLDPTQWTVHRGDRLIELTRTEFQILELFLRNPRQVLSREVVFDRVWGYDFGPASNTLDVYIGYLRRKTEGDSDARLLHTVRGVGYVLREDRA
jgi:two-component system response regulator MprA